jgi:hypothetical protein
MSYIIKFRSLKLRPSTKGAKSFSTAQTIPVTRSPVIVGAEADSPHPTIPVFVSMRTIKFSAWVIRTPAMRIGFLSGIATPNASTLTTVHEELRLFVISIERVSVRI